MNLNIGSIIDYFQILNNIVSVGYIVVSVCFILALRGLSTQITAKMGNIYGMIGMVFAFLVVIIQKVSEYYDESIYSNFLNKNYLIYLLLGYLVCIIPASFIGIIIASKVEMVQIPQLVAGFHSFVGLAAVFVGFAHWIKDANEYNKIHITGKEEYKISYLTMIGLETIIGIFIGGITFTGSIVAFGKLQGIIRSKPLLLGKYFRHYLNVSLCIIVLLSVIPFIGYEYLTYNDSDAIENIQTISLYINLIILIVVTLISFFIGWHMVMAIGGADMPVVVSMLNSYSGWATSASGFLLNNYAMIVGGALIGSSGAILSYIMCKSMNRGFMSVIFGGFGAISVKSSKKEDEGQKEVNIIQSEELAKLLVQSNNIAIVPGYGMAVSKAQHVVAEFSNILIKAGKKVRFIIHPVAGRLPGHMNVLLAEANVPYKIVLAMEEVDDIDEVDVAIVVGANDTVNPIAETDPDCPLAGMPIIDVYKAKTCIVNKRSMNQGYAAIDNPLFYYSNTRMYLEDSKKAFDLLNNELKKLLGESTQSDDKKSNEKTALLSGVNDSTPIEIQPEDILIGVLKEKYPEKMVSMVPIVCKQLRARGYGIYVESEAGLLSSYSDNDYRTVGSKIESNSEEIYKKCNIICKVNPPTSQDINNMSYGQTLISFFYPALNKELLDLAISKGINVIAMDCVPRLSKAQCMDALSSQNNLSGYRCVVEAANKFGRLLMGQVTAAGKTQPANVLVIGVGVAGLAAISTAKALGAQVKAFDTRKAAKEQAESVGAEFCTVDVNEDAEDKSGYAKEASNKLIDAEYALFRQLLPDIDIVITTANIPGKKSPILITKDMVDLMKIGSVIVDLAAANGGNCELTRGGETYTYDNKVIIIGETDYTIKMSPQASQLFSQNIYNFLNLVCKKAKEFSIRCDDPIIKAMTICSAGQKLWPSTPIEVVKQRTQTTPKPSSFIIQPTKEKSLLKNVIMISCLLLLFILLLFMPQSFVTAFMSFILAIVVGYYVISNVTSALHTPLMSVTNAISGIIAIGGITNISLISTDDLAFLICITVLGCIAVFIACLNIFGGFFITFRMLKMFH